MLTIENEFLKVAVNEKGGSMTSIYDKKRGKELLYQPIKDSWKGQDVFIFPFVARLVDQTYTYRGKSYSMKNHGLIRYMTGKGESDRTSLHVDFHSDEDTLLHYPFSFFASSHYELKGNVLLVSYVIRNESEEDMPYMVGGHPAFLLPGTRTDKEFDISGNKIVFEKKTGLVRITQEETCSFNTGVEDYGTVKEIPLSKKLFEKINTYIFKADGFDTIRLEKSDASSITMRKKSKYLALWSGNSYGNFVAIEPWNGIPDYQDADPELDRKIGMNILSPKQETTFSYSLEIK